MWSRIRREMSERLEIFGGVAVGDSRRMDKSLATVNDGAREYSPVSTFGRCELFGIDEVPQLPVVGDSRMLDFVDFACRAVSVGYDHVEFAGGELELECGRVAVAPCLDRLKQDDVLEHASLHLVENRIGDDFPFPGGD